MPRLLLPSFALLCLLASLPSTTLASDDDRAALQGVWTARSMEADGKPAPAEAVKNMRFTFKGDKLLVRGNFRDDREMECDFKVDPKQSPKHLDFKPPQESKAILGIYALKGDELKVCMRHASSSEGRPTEFASKPDSQLVLIVFQRQKK